MTPAEAIAIRLGSKVEAEAWGELVEGHRPVAACLDALTPAELTARLSLGDERFAALVMLGAQVALDLRTN